MGGQRMVEVVGTVRMAEIAHVFVIFCCTRQPEGVMPADRVLEDFDQRLHVHIIIFRREPGPRIPQPHQSTGGGDIDSSFNPFI